MIPEPMIWAYGEGLLHEVDGEEDACKLLSMFKYAGLNIFKAYLIFDSSLGEKAVWAYSPEFDLLHQLPDEDYACNSMSENERLGLIIFEAESYLASAYVSS